MGFTDEIGPQLRFDRHKESRPNPGKRTANERPEVDRKVEGGVRFVPATRLHRDRPQAVLSLTEELHRRLPYRPQGAEHRRRR